MDIFGERWEDHWDKILDNARALVGEEDLLLIAGDTSWAMTLEKARADLDLLPLLPGTKVIIRGTHDYWWSSYSKVKAALPQGVFALQNNALKLAMFCLRLQRLGEGKRRGPQDLRRGVIACGCPLTENKLKEKEDKLVVLHIILTSAINIKLPHGLVCGIRRIRGSIRTPARSRHQCQKGSAVGRHNISDQLRYAAQYPFENRFVTLH